MSENQSHVFPDPPLSKNDTDHQYNELLKAIKTLSSANPTVTVRFTAQVDRSLVNSLTQKGYNVHTNYTFKNINGNVTVDETITISLPDHSGLCTRRLGPMFFLYV